MKVCRASLFLVLLGTVTQLGLCARAEASTKSVSQNEIMPSHLRSETLPILSVDDTPAQIEQKLSIALIGHTRAEILPILKKMGAQNASVYDFRNTGLPAGTDLGDGYQAGDPLITVIFGLARGGIQPDRRLRIYLQYRHNAQQHSQYDQIQKLINIEYYAK